jgi:hypothetical protein
MLPYVPPHGPSDLPRRSCDETTIYGWLVRSADLAGVHERFDPVARRVLIDYPDEEWMLAHVTAHLDLGHVTPESEPRFTPAQEFHADALAALRFDMDERDEWEMPAMDGEPTIYGSTLG